MAHLSEVHRVCVCVFALKTFYVWIGQHWNRLTVLHVKYVSETSKNYWSNKNKVATAKKALSFQSVEHFDLTVRLNLCLDYRKLFTQIHSLWFTLGVYQGWLGKIENTYAAAPREVDKRMSVIRTSARHVNREQKLWPFLCVCVCCHTNCSK